jgi:hypothetical protein
MPSRSPAHQLILGKLHSHNTPGISANAQNMSDSIISKQRKSQIFGLYLEYRHILQHITAPNQTYYLHDCIQCEKTEDHSLELFEPP